MIEIAGRKIGPEHLPYFIADIGANHDGDLERAKKLISMAAGSGVDAVKFQNFSAPKIVSRRGFEELGKVGHQADWEGSVYEEYEKASIPLEWTAELAERARACGIEYLTTPYDLEAVDTIDPYVPAWKIGSGDITYHELIRKVASKEKPIFLATGASTKDEVEAAMIATDPVPLVLMQCNTNYTGDSANRRFLNLEVIRNWTDPDTAGTFADYVGFSDHTPGHLAVCAAVALGACVIEKHFTDDHARSGPDHAFAMEPQEWRHMIAAARITHSMLGDGVKRVEANEAKVVQRRALRWVYDLSPEDCVPSGLARENFIATRPCPEGALEPYRVDELVGRFLKRDVEADTLVTMEDFE